MDGTNAEAARETRWIDEPRNVALVVVLQGALGFALGLTIWWATGRDVAGFLTWKPSDLAVGTLTGGALIAAMQAILLAFPGFLPWAADQQRMLFEHGKSYKPVHILLIALGAGFGEEALFRGGLQVLAGDHLPEWTAIIVVSLAFAALHLQSRLVSAFIFAYGVVFGAAYHLTGSLLGVMIAHALFDLWALTIVQRELARQGLVD